MRKTDMVTWLGLCSNATMLYIIFCISYDIYSFFKIEIGYLIIPEYCK